MNAPDSPSARRLFAARVVMGLTVAFVLLAIHQAFGAVPEASSDVGGVSHIVTGSVDASHDSPALVKAPGGEGSAMECGLAMMCTAMVGLGAHLLLRAVRERSTLLKAPRALRLAIVATVATRQSQTPLQRTSVLRC